MPYSYPLDAPVGYSGRPWSVLISCRPVAAFHCGTSGGGAVRAHAIGERHAHRVHVLASALSAAARAGHDGGPAVDGWNVESHPIRPPRAHARAGRIGW